MTTQRPAGPGQAGRRIALLAALFLVPLAASYLMYYGDGRWPRRGATNQGDLIEPARPLPPVALRDAAGAPVAGNLLRDRWTILLVGDGRCDDRCRHALYVSRQTRLALNKDMNRVRRLFVATRNCCDRAYLAAEHADLDVVTLAADQSAALFDAFPTYDGIPVGESGRVYLVDPLGNLFMSYPADAPDKALLADLQRLLKLSHIG